MHVLRNIALPVIALVTILATSWALFHPSFFRVHDYVHATRVVEMLRGLQEGQLPVRWSSNLGYGYGMPLFQFYAPLPFLVGAGMFWLQLDMILVLKALYLLCNVLTFTGMYWLGRMLFGRAGGVLSAIAFTMAPYRSVNLYVRGALSEAWAMMALPWVFLGVVMLIQRKKHGLWVLLGGLITIMLSHNLTTLLFVPISLLLAGLTYITWRMTKAGKKHPKQQWQTIGATLGGYALAVGLCAFYLFPAVVEKDLTKIGDIFSGYFHYSHHFLYIRQFITPSWGYGGSAWGPEDGISFFLGYGQLLAAAVAATAVLYSIWKNKEHPQVIWTVGVAALFGLACFMAILRSQFLWDSIPLLPMVQFPWRWLSIASFMLALIAGAGVSLLPQAKLRLSVTLTIGLITLLTSWNYFRPESYMDNPQDLYYTDADKIRREMSQILPDYIPGTMSDELEAREQLFLVPDGTEQQVETLIDRGHQKLFKTTFLSPVVFNPLIASYPGWQVEIDGEQVEWGSGGQFGTISFTVPEGVHLVGVYLGRTPVRVWSDALTVVSIFILIGVASYVSLEQRRS